MLLRSERIGALEGVAHGFTTRQGGVTPGPTGPLDLARREDVPDTALVENWRRVIEALAGPALQADDVALLHQVHGARVLEVSAPSGPLSVVGEADAAFTRRAGVVLAVRTADCVPVLLVGREAVAVAHAGWRGTAAGVVAATVDALVAAGEDPADLVVAIGPSISGASYEVGEEVVDGLRASGLADADFLVAPRSAGGRPHVDLRRAVAAQLRDCGVHHIDRVGGCTLADPTLHSHRRDGPRSGRMAGLIARCA